MASPIKIYGMLQSTCTQRVLLTCLELSIPYELIEVNMMKGEHHAPSYITSHHPFGRVPAIEDGSVHLFESRAICAYLLAKSLPSDVMAPPPLEPGPRGVFDEAASVEYSYFDPAMKTIAYEKVFKAFMGKGGPDEGIVAAQTEALRKVLDWYESRLASQKWLVNDDYSIVDLCHTPWLAFLPRVGLEGELESRKNVKAWWGKLQERESWKKLQALQSEH